MVNNKDMMLRVVQLSMDYSERHLPMYSHLKSPKKFTQVQLVTCLVLRKYLEISYRETTSWLNRSEELRECLGLKKVPHYSTLKHFADRSKVSVIIDAILEELENHLNE